jgi:hypothetical protein
MPCPETSLPQTPTRRRVRPLLKVRLVVRLQRSDNAPNPNEGLHECINKSEFNDSCVSENPEKI